MNTSRWWLGLRVGMLILWALAGVPVGAQPEPYRVALPALYRSVAATSGWVGWLTTSRIAPGLALAVTATQIDGSHLQYRLLISPDEGLTWRPTTTQPWASMLGPSYYWEDMLAARILRVNGVVTLVARSDLVQPLTFFVSGDLGEHWDARRIPKLLDCPDFVIMSIVTTPAAPEQLVVAGHCWASFTPDSRPVLLTSSDAAQTWSILDVWSDGEPPWPGPTVASPVNAEVFYQFAQPNWRLTRDRTVTWENVVIPGSQLLLSPNDVDTLAVIGPSDGYGLTSRDGGLTWQGWPDVPCAHSIWHGRGPVWLRGPTETLVAICVDGPLIRSYDGGQTWASFPLPDGLYPTLLAADDSRPGGLYLQMAMPGSGLAQRLYRSQDAGATWQDVLSLTAP